MDCGPACLKMIAAHYNLRFKIESLPNIAVINEKGMSMLAISDAANKMGLRTAGVRMPVEKLTLMRLPVILKWDKYHFVVLFKVDKDLFYVADPVKEIIAFKKADFLKHWISEGALPKNEGIALTLRL